MTDRTVTAIPASTQVPAARLEPDAISAAQDTIIGMGNSAPTVALGLSLAALVLASAYGSGPGHHPVRDPDAGHRQRLPAAESVER